MYFLHVALQLFRKVVLHLFLLRLPLLTLLFELQVVLPMLMALMAGVWANVVVSWDGCIGEFQQTEATDEGCTNVSGFKEDNLCGVAVGSNHCDFYTTACGVPWGSTYSCSHSDGECNAQSWASIESYRFYTAERGGKKQSIFYLGLFQN